MVPSWKDEIPDEALVSVDDEVSAKLLRFFVVRYQFGGGHVANVAAHGLTFFVRFAAISSRILSGRTRTMIGTRPQSLRTDRSSPPCTFQQSFMVIRPR